MASTNTPDTLQELLLKERREMIKQTHREVILIRKRSQRENDGREFKKLKI
jgi:hypothetical protein